ncbi:hypothetical protein TNCV_421581 [Trichonephila clavipes]|nr:hypothetical protein TNCV_421581 [Trichonephila clavipes]
MSRLGGQSEARPPVFKSPSKLGTHLLTHCCYSRIRLGHDSGSSNEHGYYTPITALYCLIRYCSQPLRGAHRDEKLH